MLIFFISRGAFNASVSKFESRAFLSVIATRLPRLLCQFGRIGDCFPMWKIPLGTPGKIRSTTAARFYEIKCVNGGSELTNRRSSHSSASLSLRF